MKRLKFLKHKKLASVIRNEYIRSIVYPLLIIEITLLFAYFWSNHYVNSVTQKVLIDEAKINIVEISQRSAKNVDGEFRSIAQTTALLQFRHEEFFEHFHPKEGKHSDTHYQTMDDSVIVNAKKESGSCTLFYSNVAKNTPMRMEKAIQSEALDPFYNHVLSSNENMVQVYFNSYDSMNRLCPYMDDALAQYPHDINIPSYNFYYLADLNHNPKQRVVWTDAYLDPAGKGWMISAIAPVYHKKFLEGVVGIDITLEKILSNILSIKLPYTTFAMLVDKSGNILAMSKDLEPLIGVKELTTHDYKNPIKETISKPKDFNILEQDHNPLIKRIGDILEHKCLIDEFNENDQHYLITKNTIDQTGWKLILLVDKNSLLANTSALKKKTDNIGYLILSLMVIFYILFFVLIIRRSKKFSETILHPIENLVNATSTLKNNLEMVKLEYSNINEIDILIDNFTQMGSELQTLYTTMQNKIDEGIAKNNETQQMMIYQSRLAAMGEMVSMIAHQWRQPISVISLIANNIYLDLELNTLKEETIRSSVLKTLDLAQDLSKTIDDFMNFFKPDKNLVDIELDKVLDDAMSVIGKTIEHSAITVERPKNNAIVFRTHARELVQVIINILKNAKDAFENEESESKKIIIDADQNDDEITITICDNAGGIPEEIIERIFDPYFTTRENLNGSGLGLYISKMIIEKHLKGSLVAENRGDGACFKITFPLLETDVN